MHRRALLASLGVGIAGLAGCTVSSTGPETTTTGDPTTDEPTTTTEDDDTRPEPPDQYASVVELETGPRTYAFRPVQRRTDDGGEVALWFDRTATADGPALLTGYLENANDFENTFRVEWIPAVGRVNARQPRDYSHEARLHLAPTEHNELATEVPELVRDESGFWQVEDVDPWMPETYRMDPGEVVELEYAVVGEPGVDDRPTGTYEFRGIDDTASITVWDTDSPGPEAASRFAGREVPAFGGEPTTAWFHDADASTAVYVEPSTERLELDGLVEFEVVNHSHESVGCGHWDLYKLVDGEWFHVGPMGHTADCRLLPPGQRESWRLRAFNDDPVECGRDCDDGLTRGFLGGGEYAAVAGYGHLEDESAALVEFVGDPVELRPTEDATVERDGDTVTVTTERYGRDDSDDAALTVERADSADERLVVEQLMADTDYAGFGGPYRALRNALALFESDVEAVVVRTDQHDVDRTIGHGETQRRFSVRDRAYVATAERSSD
jgi:hypothetical protein